jgi:hypothetical protein
VEALGNGISDSSGQLATAGNGFFGPTFPDLKRLVYGAKSAVCDQFIHHLAE